jgi:hypothetical protein
MNKRKKLLKIDLQWQISNILLSLAIADSANRLVQEKKHFPENSFLSLDFAIAKTTKFMINETHSRHIINSLLAF